MYATNHTISNKVYATTPYGSLSSDASLTLDSSLTELEILNALKSFKPFKSPDLDELDPVFYQKIWPQVSSSVIDFFHKVFQSKAFPRQLNQTFLCLIISLCNTMYKFIIKIIVNRIKSP